MTATRTALVAAMLVLAGCGALYRAVGAPRATLAATRARFEPVATVRRGDGRAARLAQRLAAGPLGRLVDARLGVDLRLADTTVTAVIARMVAIIGVSAIALLLTVGGLIAGGFAPASPAWLPVLVGVPAAFGAGVLNEVATVASRRRRALRRVVNDFVQLLAVALTTNRSIEESIEFAANAGEGVGFDLLRDTVRAARPMGIPVWESLSTMAEIYGLDDLKGLTGALRRQADIGVSVAQTVRTEAAAMRYRQLDELTDRADRANANLSVPTLGIVLGMVLFLAFPIARQISQAFA